VTHQDWHSGAELSAQERAYRVLHALLRDGDVQQFLSVNRYQGILWFNKEAFEELLDGLFMLAVVQISADPARSDGEQAQAILDCRAVMEALRQAEERSGYQVEKLLEFVTGQSG